VDGSGSVTAGAIPEPGVLLGAVNVMTTDGVKVGSNEVVVSTYRRNRNDHEGAAFGRPSSTSRLVRFFGFA
jgi:hypothetical protein